MAEVNAQLQDAEKKLVEAQERLDNTRKALKEAKAGLDSAEQKLKRTDSQDEAPEIQQQRDNRDGFITEIRSLEADVVQCQELISFRTANMLSKSALKQKLESRWVEMAIPAASSSQGTSSTYTSADSTNSISPEACLAAHTTTLLPLYSL